MICARCDEPIDRDEDAKAVDHHGASGPGMTVYVHQRRCQPAPQQTYPVPHPARPKPRRR